MKNPFLVGEHVYLRALERADAPVILPWVNDPAVIHHLLIHRPMNLAEEEAFIDAVNRSATDVVFGICQREPDRLVGVTGLHRMDHKNRHAMFGIFIGEADARGHGFGTQATALVVRYAFGTANLNRVWLHVYEDNPGAIHVYEKLGFVREGLLRHDTFRRGRYGNTVVMGLLRADRTRRKRNP
jgi:RimJ/RimL family protein N-acetyltransferase